jgi:integrase
MKTDCLHSVDLAEVLGTVKPVAPAPPPETLAELWACLATWNHWPKGRRKVYASSILTAALIAQTGTLCVSGRRDFARRVAAASASPCAIPWLNAHLFRAAPKAHQLTSNSFSNLVSALRSTLREARVMPPEPPPPPGSSWCGLLDALKADKHCRMGLTRFAGWCHAHGIAPNDVASETLSAFETYLTGAILHSDIPGLVRTLAKAWRKASRLVADWPARQLEPPRRRQTYTLPFERFPRSFQDEVRQFRATLAGATRQGPFRGDGPPRTLRASTIKTRLYCVRQAASALAIIRGDIETITGLADLIEEKALKEILLFYWERAIASRVARGEFSCADAAPVEAGVTWQTAGIASTLMMIARYHCRLAPDVLKRLREHAADLQPSRQGSISAKVLERLRQFDDPQTRIDLLDLPETLMRRAEGLLRDAEQKPDKRMKAAYLARTAAALMILLHIPLRIGNLSRLRLGQHLKFAADGTGMISHLVLQRHETKNRSDAEWSVDVDTAGILDRYRKRFLPLLAEADCPWLFPGRGGAKAISVDGLRYHIVGIVADELGPVINVHLFRPLAVRFVLEDSPGALEDARELLGDTSMQTVLAHYAARAPAMAAARQHDRLRRARAEAVRRTMPQPKKRRR